MGRGSQRRSGETLHWHATGQSSLETSGDWFIERQPDGAQWQHRTDTAEVTVNGPAKNLLRILTRRLSRDRRASPRRHDRRNVDLVRHWIRHTAQVTG